MNAPEKFGNAELRDKVKIAANGRMVLPKAMRDAIGIEGETTLFLTVKNGQIEIATIAETVRRAQELFRKSVKHPFSSDDFLATRERD